MSTLLRRLSGLLTLALALTLATFVPAVANDDGRPPGSEPGPITRESTEPRERSQTGWDGDGPAPRTLVHSGDSTIQGGLCVGFDCASNEPMGFATIKIEENNLRIAAADSSTVSGFPTRDWQIEFNSSSSGGGDYFKIRDCGSGGAAGSVDSTCGGTSMFTIEGGADNDSIYVDSAGNQGGNVGFGTATPVVDTHAVSGNTPTHRLEQDGSSGFTAQTWDLAGNEANFFIRDVTNGSALPFRIEPGTASNTLYLDNAEHVGIKTTAPQVDLHVRGDLGEGNNATVYIESPNHVSRLRFVSPGNNTIVDEWEIGNANNGNFVINDQATVGTNELILTSSGNLTITGDLTANGTLYTSDAAAKINFADIDPAAILDAIAELDVQTWSYRNDRAGTVHIGPTAQDFKAAFGFGSSDTAISAVDVNGVTLAAIQALEAENDDLRARVEALEAALAELLDG